MPLLPDPATAGIAAGVVFLITLGILVLFIEMVPLPRFIGIVVGCLVVAVFLVVLGEVGLALLPLAVAGAFLANHVFEWLTTR